MKSQNKHIIWTRRKLVRKRKKDYIYNENKFLEQNCKEKKLIKREKPVNEKNKTLNSHANLVLQQNCKKNQLQNLK